MVDEATVKSAWQAGWGKWAGPAVPKVRANAEACKTRTGLDRMACIAAANSTTVTKKALGLAMA